MIINMSKEIIEQRIINIIDYVNEINNLCYNSEKLNHVPKI